MERLCRAIFALGLFAPGLFGQRILRTAALPDPTTRNILGVAKDSAGNDFVASGQVDTAPPLGPHLTGLFYLTKYSSTGNRLYETVI
jgi:hypothetical protein